MRDQFRGELDDPRSGDVRQHGVESAVDVAQRSERRLQATVHAVNLCIASCRFDRVRLHVERNDARRAELERTESENSASAADVEDPLASGDPLNQFCNDLLGRGMATVSESTQSELNHPWKMPAIMLRPRLADAESFVEGDGASVSQPRLEGRSSVWPRHRHRALGTERHDEAGHAPLVIRGSQHHQAAVAGRHDVYQAHAE